ncbi:MAG: hypothetical protein ACREP2_01580 [Rhodanobacteraceae bacterium]
MSPPRRRFPPQRPVTARQLDEAVAGALGMGLAPEQPGGLDPAERFRLALRLIAEVQAPYAMTTPESRARIRALADRLEGKP